MKSPTTANFLRPQAVEKHATPHAKAIISSSNGQHQTYGLFWKTQLCSKWKATGSCPKKDQCSFAHSLEELRELPDLRCTKWCRRVFRGLQCEDPGCPYAHSREQLRCNSHQLLAFKTALCKFYARGMCLSGDACRFAHTLKELRRPGALVISNVEAGERQPSQLHVEQAAGAIYHCTVRIPANKNGGDSSKFCCHRQRTACPEGNNDGCMCASKGGADSAGRLLASGRLRARHNERGLSRIQFNDVSYPFAPVKLNEESSEALSVAGDSSCTALKLIRPHEGPGIQTSTAHEKEGQLGTESNKDGGNSRDISICKATEILSGIASSTTSRTTSRSSSKSYPRNAAESKVETAKVRPGDAWNSQGSRTSPQGDMKKAAHREIRKGELQKQAPRMALTTACLKSARDDLRRISLQGWLIESKANGTPETKEEPTSKADGESSSSPVSPSCTDTFSTTAPTGTAAQTTVSTAGPTYTKEQLLAIGAYLHGGRRRLASRFCEACAVKSTTDIGLTFCVAACSEDNGARTVTEVAQSNNAQFLISDGHLQDAVQRRQYQKSNEAQLHAQGANLQDSTGSRRNQTWPTTCSLHVLASPAMGSHQHRLCSNQSFSVAAGVTGTDVPFYPAIQPRRREQLSSRTSSPPAAPLLCSLSRSVHKTSTRRSRGASKTAAGFKPRTRYKIFQGSTTATRKALSSTDSPLRVHALNAQVSPLAPRPSQDPFRTDTTAWSQLPPAAFLMYTQALEAAMVAAATRHQSLEATRKPEQAAVASKLEIKSKNEGELTSSSYVETLNMHARSMALVALAALCRLALLPSHEPSFLQRHNSPPSSYTVLGSQQPLELTTNLEHLESVCSPSETPPPDANACLTAAGPATKLKSNNGESIYWPVTQPQCEQESRVEDQRETYHQQQPLEQPDFQISEAEESIERTSVERPCANDYGTDTVIVKDSNYCGCPRCLFLAALREHQVLLQHTSTFSSPLSPLDIFFQRIASGCCSDTAATSHADASAMAVVEEEEEQQPPPPELVASLLRYVQVASDLQQARAF